MFSWFGKDEASKVISGVGGWIDEQQFTPQEQLEGKLKLLGQMAPFKIVQRIIVTIVFGCWAVMILLISLSIFLEHFTGNSVAREGFMGLIGTQYVWGPTVAASALYLGGGLAFFSGKKK